MKADQSLQEQPVIPRLEEFDQTSGNLLERLLFNHRFILVCVCALLTVFLGYHASQLRVNAGFEKMIPLQHPYIMNYMENKDQLRRLGNSIRIAVETTEGTIYDAAYLETLKKINDETLLSKLVF